MALTIRINGQLMLLMLAEGLDALGCKIIQSNTDGVFVLMKKSIVEEAHK
jgi:DNA polymerase elongation subunit (family B)